MSDPARPAWPDVVATVASARDVSAEGDQALAERERVRAFASSLRRDDASPAQLVLRLQREASDGAERDAIDKIVRRDDERRATIDGRHRATRSAGQARRATPARASTVRTGIPTIIALIVAVAAPVAAFPRFREPGFILELPEAIVIAAAVALLPCLWFVVVEPRRGLGERIMSNVLLVLLGLWTASAAGFTLWRLLVLGEEASALVVLGCVVVVAEAVAYVWAYVRARRGRAPATPREERAAADDDRWEALADADTEALEKLEAALRRQPDEAARVRRAAVLDGIGTLYKRGVIDADEAREALRDGLV